MNPVIKIITQIIIQINRIIDSLDRKTIEKIKQYFFLSIFLLIILGILIGYNTGKNAAKRYGAPLTESTNEAFDVTIKKNMDNAKFRSMLETELVGERNNLKLKKITFQSKENVESKFEHNIVEKESDIKKTPSGHLKLEKIAEINIIDEVNNKPEIKVLEKKSEPQEENNSNTHIKETSNNMFFQYNKEKKEKKDSKSNRIKTSMMKDKKLFPIDRESGIVEK